MVADSNDKSQETAHDWALQPFRDFVDQVDRLSHLVNLSMRGISMIQGVPRLVDALAKGNGDEDDGIEERRARAVIEAELARREVAEGFPLLHAQATIALWSMLESAVRLFLVRWLQNYVSAMQVDAVQKLRVRISEYERMDGEDRFFYILERLEQELSSPLKSGISRFESMLEPFGLAGPVDDKLRRDLFELSQVRNTLVHRSSVVDRRLATACPWMQVNVGDTLMLDHSATHRYSEAVMAYALELIIRVREHFGVDMSAFRNNS